MKRKYLIVLKGRLNRWITVIELTDEAADDMIADGIEIAEFIGIIPGWVRGLGMSKVWLFAADVFNFRNPFR